MEQSPKDLREKVEILTAAVLATVAKETAWRKELDIELAEILDELNSVKESIEKTGRYQHTASILEHAEQNGWTLREPDRMRGQYFGPVVALDHLGFLVKYTSTEVIELLFNELAVGQERPRMGDSIRLEFKDGVARVSVAGRSSRRQSAGTL